MRTVSVLFTSSSTPRTRWCRVQVTDSIDVVGLGAWSTSSARRPAMKSSRRVARSAPAG
ncbi:MAG TPA: hypothetical protein VFL83_23220 [Anaeromyxobacter sp.]|nr:hypothetical protein [Anaeromyxobacter sp.]